MKKIITLCCALLLLGAPLVAASSQLFQYTNAQGELEFNYTLPSGQEERGYKVIDPITGEVIRDVAPVLPPDQLAEKLRRDQVMRECRDELDRIYQLYGSEADIDYALQETLESLETRIGQLQANLRQARRERDRLRAQAVDAERGGRKVPQSLSDNLQRSRSQIATLEGEIELREGERETTRTRYDHERARFLDGTCPAPGAVAGRN
ncbi:MAG: hypothetical protein RIC56_06535 [Pseudomonadales bacterium]